MSNAIPAGQARIHTFALTPRPQKT